MAVLPPANPVSEYTSQISLPVSWCIHPAAPAVNLAPAVNYLSGLEEAEVLQNTGSATTAAL